ncbi:MAG: hypothetical protein IJJ86_02905 [Clostridia bacterium]|nr:hypothetical protein [Clostridia bacterium]
MKRRLLAVLLLAVLLLPLFACGGEKRDELYGTWELVSSKNHPEITEGVADGSYRRTYTFDGKGTVVRTVYENGAVKKGSFPYEILDRGTPMLRIDGWLDVPYSVTDDSLMLQIKEGNGWEFLACVREE